MPFDLCILDCACLPTGMLELTAYANMVTGFSK